MLTVAGEPRKSCSTDFLTSRAVLIFPDFLERETKISEKAQNDPAKKSNSWTNKVREWPTLFPHCFFFFFFLIFLFLFLLIRFSQSTRLRDTFLRPRANYAGEIWRRRIHSENASNVFRSRFAGDNQRSIWICVVICEENSGREITWLSWRHNFRITPISKCFPSTLKRTAGF